jgi:hypothetical protein
MTFRTFALLPFVLALMLLGVHTAVTPWAHWGHGLDIVSLVAKIAALVGGIIAARAFDRGDYMRRAFVLEAATYGFLVTRDCLAMVPPLRLALETAHVFDTVWRILFVSANVAGVAGAFMMALAARLALFDSEETRFRGHLWLGLAALIGLTFTGPSIVTAALDIGEGRPHSFVVLIGSLADLGAFVLTVPVVRLAYALRGGLLYIPWTLVATARMFWLVRDAFGVAPPWLQGHQAFMIAAEAARTLACCYAFSAGLAFRRIFAAPTEPRAD